MRKHKLTFDLNLASLVCVVTLIPPHIMKLCSSLMSRISFLQHVKNQQTLTQMSLLWTFLWTDMERVYVKVLFRRVCCPKAAWRWKGFSA